MVYDANNPVTAGKALYSPRGLETLFRLLTRIFDHYTKEDDVRRAAG
jgi:hypothetical protein